MEGLKRNLEHKINELLEIFPIVLLVGARQVGKTTLAKKIRPTWKYFDLENINDFNTITEDYDLFFREYPTEIIIDEAQENPQLFRQLRGVVDGNRDLKGRFILTGSSSPDLLREASDSLAGRVGIIHVGTLKVNELEAAPMPGFYEVFKDKIDSETIKKLRELKPLKADYLQHFLAGTYPEAALIRQESEQKYFLWMQNYQQTYINRDVRKLFPRLDITKYKRFISMLSQLSGTIINKAQLGQSIDVSEVTIRDYLEIADGTFIWRNIPSFEKAKTKSIIKMPKGIFRDSGLSNYIAGILSRDDLFRSPLSGQNFETFVIEELLKGMESLILPKWAYHYYRTKSGAEVDLVLSGSFGILPIEIKFGTHTSLKQISSLRRFVSDLDLPLGIVINNSEEIRMIAENVIQIPVNYI